MKIENFLATLARNKGWSVALGLISVIAGILVIFWPRETVQILAVVFGARLVFYGVGELVDSVASAGNTNDPRWLMGLMGILSVCVGILCVRNVFATIAVIALVLGIYLVANGILELFTAIADSASSGRRWAGLLGGISLLTGLALLVYPGLTLLYAAVVLGVFLILAGSIKIAWDVLPSRS